MDPLSEVIFCELDDEDKQKYPELQKAINNRRKESVRKPKPFAQAFAGHRKRKRGGPAAKPKRKAAHNAPPEAIPVHNVAALLIPPEALILPPPVIPLQGFYFDYSRHRKTAQTTNKG